MAERLTILPDNLTFLNESEVRGVSKKLVADLWDIVNKRGIVDPNRGMTEFQFSVPTADITLLISTSTEYGGMIVQRDRQIQMSDIAILETNLLPKIGWDKRLSAKDAKVAVTQIDKELRSNGQFNEDGTRKHQRPENSLKTTKIAVLEVLDSPNSIFVTQAATKDAALLNFDNPELIEVVNFSNGIAIVRLKAR